jgi:hypothetical protein
VARPEYKGIDPADRVTYQPGQLTHATCASGSRIPVAPGQKRMLPVLVIVLR